jgi:hypothetical protein
MSNVVYENQELSTILFSELLYRCSEQVNRGSGRGFWGICLFQGKKFRPKTRPKVDKWVSGKIRGSPLNFRLPKYLCRFLGDLFFFFNSFIVPLMGEDGVLVGVFYLQVGVQEFFYELSAVAADFVLLPLADAYNDLETGTA